MVKKRFSKPIRVNIAPFFSLLLRKKGKKSCEGMAVAGSPTAATATGVGVWVRVRVRVRVRVWVAGWLG